MNRRLIMFISLLLLCIYWSSWHLKVEAQTKRVLTPADFQYVGAMRVPKDVTGYGRGGRITHRIVNGQVRFFLTGTVFNNGPVFEIDAPGFALDWTQAPRASVVRAWGDVYQGRKVAVNQQSMIWTEDLEWFNGQLYWVYGDTYNVAGYDDPVIGLTNEQGQASGPWRTSLHNKLTRGHVTTIPQWYATQYLGGRRFAIGSGLRSGNQGYSWGPNLNAVEVPTATTPTPQRLAATKLLEYFVDFNYLNDPNAPPFPPFLTPCCDTRLSRPADYTHSTFPSNRNGGWWTDTDIIHSAVWIDTPTIHGVIFMGSQGSGQMWYGPSERPGGPNDTCWIAQWQGPHSEQYRQRWWFYDPMSFAPVSGKLPHEPRPTSIIDPNTVAQGWIAFPCLPNSGGATFEPSTGMLYFAMEETDHQDDTRENLPVIYAFRILDKPTAPDTQPPTVPGNLRASVVGSNVRVEWNASTDNVGVTGYEVTVNGVVAGTETDLDYLLPWKSGQVDRYKVRARDAAGNWSALSPELTFTHPPDTTPPTVPQGLAAKPSGANAVISWQASTDAGGSGIALYNLRVDGTVLFSGPALTHTAPAMPGQTYTLEVQVCDVAKNCSAFSAPVKYVHPTPPSAPTIRKFCRYDLVATAPPGLAVKQAQFARTPKILIGAPDTTGPQYASPQFYLPAGKYEFFVIWTLTDGSTVTSIIGPDTCVVP